MAYEKQTWTTGEVITQEKLNHMEDGIAEGGGVVVVNVTTTASEGGTVTTLDKTWQEIYDALNAGVVLQFVEGGDGFYYNYPLDHISSDGNRFSVALTSSWGAWSFYASSPTGYPEAFDE